MKEHTSLFKSKTLRKMLICLMFIGLFSVTSFAQNEEWYLVFANGNAPKRAAFFIDMNSVKSP